jgi:hypothetical protein
VEDGVVLTWIPPYAITQDQLVLLAESLNAAPAYEARDGVELLSAIHHSLAHAFALPDDGLMVLEPKIGADGSRRLSIIAFSGDGAIFLRKGLVGDLRKVALEWGCDTIETIAYDPRLARAIEKVGGRVESICLTLALED